MKNNNRCSRLKFLACVHLWSLCVFISPSFASNFIGLGYSLGGSYYSPTSVSADGSVVVGYANSSFGSEAFQWSQSTGMVSLGFLPGGVTSYAAGVSADGSVITGSSLGQTFRWSQATGMVGLGLTGGYSNFGQGISADGSVIVGNKGPYPGEAFRWTSETGFVGLGYLPGDTESYASSVSADGNVVAGWSRLEGSRIEAFRWSSSTGMVGLGDFPGSNFWSISHGVSADGSVVVGISDGAGYFGHEAFRWTEATGMVSLGYLPSGCQYSEARAVSADGAIVVGAGYSSCLSGNVIAASIWDAAHGMRSIKSVLQNDYNIDMSGWDLREAFAVSADGRTIVGIGTNPSGLDEAWLAQIDPVPLPAAFWLFGSGLVGLIAVAQRKKAQMIQ